MKVNLIMIVKDVVKFVSFLIIYALNIFLLKYNFKLKLDYNKKIKYYNIYLY